jgi:tetratricopeptide (TPR) repeat protein
MINDFSFLESESENAARRARTALDSRADYMATIALRELGRKKLKDMPESSEANFNLGILELESFNEPSDALRYFMQACRLNPSASVEWFYAGAANLRLGRFEPAIGCFRRAEDAGHHTAATAELSGDAHFSLGRYEAARSSYRRAFGRDGDSAEIRSKLGLAEVRSGMIREGLSQLKIAVRLDSASRAPHDRLIAAQMSLGHMAEAVQAAEYEIGHVETQPEDFLRAAGMCIEPIRRSRNLNILRAGIARFPASAALRKALTSAESVLVFSPALPWLSKSRFGDH